MENTKPPTTKGKIDLVDGDHFLSLTIKLDI